LKAKHLLRSSATVSFGRETPQCDVKDGSLATFAKPVCSREGTGACAVCCEVMLEFITSCNMRCFNDYSLQTADATQIANCGRFVSLQHGNTGIQNPGQLQEQTLKFNSTMRLSCPMNGSNTLKQKDIIKIWTFEE